MPVTQDGDRRVLELAFDVPGTPEQVWQAIATGPGISAWFTPCTVDEREGGAIAFSFGIGVESSGRITTWQPPHRFAYEEPGWVDGMPPLASEFRIETRSGGGCTVRLVHSLFASDEAWDDQFDGMAAGWPPFFRVLALYLRGFAGQRCSSLTLSGFHADDQDAAWTQLTQLLALPAQAEAGDPYAMPDGMPDLRGQIEFLALDRGQRHLLLQLHEPAPGAALFSVFAWEAQARVNIQMYFYGYGHESLRDEQARHWQDWLSQHFPAPAPTGAS